MPAFYTAHAATYAAHKKTGHMGRLLSILCFCSIGNQMTTGFVVVVLWFALLAGIAAIKRGTMENVLTLVLGGMILMIVGQVIYYAAR